MDVGHHEGFALQNLEKRLRKSCLVAKQDHCFARVSSSVHDLTEQGSLLEGFVGLAVQHYKTIPVQRRKVIQRCSDVALMCRLVADNVVLALFAWRSGGKDVIGSQELYRNIVDPDHLGMIGPTGAKRRVGVEWRVDVIMSRMGCVFF